MSASDIFYFIFYFVHEFADERLSFRCLCPQ